MGSWCVLAVCGLAGSSDALVVQLLCRKAYGIDCERRECREIEISGKRSTIHLCAEAAMSGSRLLDGLFGLVLIGLALSDAGKLRMLIMVMVI